MVNTTVHFKIGRIEFECDIEYTTFRDDTGREFIDYCSPLSILIKIPRHGWRAVDPMKLRAAQKSNVISHAVQAI